MCNYVSSFVMELMNNVYNDSDYNFPLTFILNTCLTGIYMSKLSKFTEQNSWYLCQQQEKII
jgi:hypothetical protein